ELVPVRPYQIVVWVSLGIQDVLDKDAMRFPAVLDSGHTHNFSIRADLLSRWAGLQAEALGDLGSILVNRAQVPLRPAHLWVHRNQHGSEELLPRPFRLSIPQGIAVYPVGTAASPRLPLLGLRSLVRSKLRLTIDGDKMRVSLRS